MKQYLLKDDGKGNKIYVSDVHKILLEMIKHIDEICRKHGIEYFLEGGSALGAIRHKGFIPWDDDFDISMTRDNFRRFIKILQIELADEYLFQCFETHKEYNVLIPAMKIRKKNTYIEEVNVLLKNKCKDGDGVFIDVFIYDHANKNAIIDKYHRCLSCLMMPFIAGIEILGFNPLILKNIFVDHAIRYGEKNKSNKLLGLDLTWTFMSPFKPLLYDHDDIFPCRYVQFCDTKLPVANNIDKFLVTNFGANYMQLPNVKTQKPKHIKDINI